MLDNSFDINSALNRIYAIPFDARLETLEEALLLQDGVRARALLEEWTGLRVTGLLLFGSRARDQARPTSDVDAAVFLEAAELPAPLSHGFRSARLDLELVTDETVATAGSERIYWLPGRPLYDPQGRLASLLESLAVLRARGPAPMEPALRRRWEIWSERMLARIQENLAEGEEVLADCQMGWLQHDLLGIAADLRGRWGSSLRDTLAWIRGEEPYLAEILTALARARGEQRLGLLREFVAAIRNPEAPPPERFPLQGEPRHPLL